MCDRSESPPSPLAGTNQVVADLPVRFWLWNTANVLSLGFLPWNPTLYCTHEMSLIYKRHWKFSACCIWPLWSAGWSFTFVNKCMQILLDMNFWSCSKEGLKAQIKSCRKILLFLPAIGGSTLFLLLFLKRLVLVLVPSRGPYTFAIP